MVMGLLSVFSPWGGGASEGAADVGQPTWITTGTAVKITIILLASSVFMFSIAAVLHPVAPIIEEVLDEEPEEASAKRKRRRGHRKGKGKGKGKSRGIGELDIKEHLDEEILLTSSANSSDGEDVDEVDEQNKID